MSEKKRPALDPAAEAARNADRKSNAGPTPDPWEACATLEYGGDRSFAWSVREQVVRALPEEKARAEQSLHKALGRKDCTEAGRAFLCQMLALVSTSKSVTALAPLLKDPKSADAARYALEAIPGPEVDAALRDALGSLSGNPKAGLIGSIAKRRDTTARAVLAGIRENPSETPIVREAAARALDHLTTAKS
jgi:hypothetical protein